MGSSGVVISEAFEAIEANEPVGLVEAVFAHERSCGERKAGSALG